METIRTQWREELKADKEIGGKAGSGQRLKSAEP